MLGVCFGAQCLPTSTSPTTTFTPLLVDVISDHIILERVKSSNVPGLASWLHRIRSILCPILQLSGRSPGSICNDLLTPIPTNPMPPVWTKITPIIHFTSHVKHSGRPPLLAKFSILETLSTAAREFPARQFMSMQTAPSFRMGERGPPALLIILVLLSFPLLIDSPTGPAVPSMSYLP